MLILQLNFFILKFLSVILYDAMDSTFIAPKVSDNSLMSSMMSRLTTVKKQLSEAEAKLKEKVGCISVLHFCISFCSAYDFCRINKCQKYDLKTLLSGNLTQALGFHKWGELLKDIMVKKAKNCLKIAKSTFLGENSGSDVGETCQILGAVGVSSYSRSSLGETLDLLFGIQQCKHLREKDCCEEYLLMLIQI